MIDRFNLIDEPWIPVVDKGLVSLKQVFSEPCLRALGGNPVQKIALMKLLQSPLRYLFDRAEQLLALVFPPAWNRTRR